MSISGEKLLKISPYGGWATHFLITKESEKKLKNQNIHRNQWKCKHNDPKLLGHCKSSAKGKVHSSTGLPQETKKKSNK